MKKNVGSADKAFRVAIALLVGVLIYTEVLTGTLAIVLGVVSIVLVLTSFLGICLLYSIFGINTCKRK
jgi:hypothetical protein